MWIAKILWPLWATKTKNKHMSHDSNSINVWDSDTATNWLIEFIDGWPQYLDYIDPELQYLLKRKEDLS